MTTKTWTSWGTLELRTLAELRGDGLTAAAIAAVMGRTLAAVRCKLQVLKLRKRRDALKYKWLPILREPHTIAGVAEALGVTKWAVKAAKQRLRGLGYKVVRLRGKGAER